MVNNHICLQRILFEMSLLGLYAHLVGSVNGMQLFV